MKRRLILQGLAGALTVGIWCERGLALPDKTRAAMDQLFGERPMQNGRIKIDIPKLSENGYSVPLTIDVESPMTATDHVRQIAVFAEANPLPDIIRFHLGPRAGLARVQTRIRLGASQRLHVVAEMNDGSLWTSDTFTVVTLAACVIEG